MRKRRANAGSLLRLLLKKRDDIKIVPVHKQFRLKLYFDFCKIQNFVVVDFSYFGKYEYPVVGGYGNA